MSNDLGMDRSGNGNNWTVNNLAYSDQVVDSPTNNFATLNPLVKHTNVATTYAEGNLKATKAATYWTSTLANMYVDSGKWYAEFCCLTDGVYMIFGINAEGDLYANNHPGADSSGYGYGYVFDTAAGRGDITYQDSTVSTGGAFNNLAVGTIIGITLDFDNNQVKFYANNVLQYTQTIGARAYTYSVAPHGGSVVANFGQDSSFAGVKTAQGNQDSGGIGDFYYTPPTGFKALCTSNLPDVAVVPSEHFNTVLYTGNSGTNAVTGVGFQPDFTWLKVRDIADVHALFDSVRGVNKRLYAQATNAEMTGSNQLDSWGADGFTLGADGAGQVNLNTKSYAAWNWKAPTAFSNDASVTGIGDIDSSGKVNVDAGFSIITMTNTGEDDRVAHGLSKAPELVIVKGRATNSDSWYVQTTVIDGSLDYLLLESTAAKGNLGYAAPTATTFASMQIGVGSGQVAYCFHSVDGYSKVGSYIANGDEDGAFVYTGFRPAFLLRKKSSGTGYWIMQDNKRPGYNTSRNNSLPTNQNVLYANTSDAEVYNNEVSFLSNGFKSTATDAFGNTNGETIIYIAFAETPFKYSNAR